MSARLTTAPSASDRPFPQKEPCLPTCRLLPALWTLSAAAWVACSTHPSESSRPGGVTRPNIVLVLSDDQRWDLMQYLPITTSRLSNRSVRFTNAFASTPLCCPSRASILTGRYAHNHGVLQNGLPNGGATKFNATATMAVWLQQSGYRTGFVGKYLNDYVKLAPAVQPGWTVWQAFFSDDGVFYNYKFSENGVERLFGGATQDYSTDVVKDKAMAFIEGTPLTQPFFLLFAPVAPHAPAIPAQRDIGTFASLPPWRPPAYNEADVSDKPFWIRQLPLISSTTSASSDALHQRQVESLQALDRAVGAILDTLGRLGRLSNTYIIYTSDNGLSWGEHRWVDSKACVYEECVRVPLWVAGPGITGRPDGHLVENIDLAPTILELAGVAPQAPVDGRSLVPLLANGSAPWRTEVLLEYLGSGSSANDFSAVRTSGYVYAEYANGDRELYDLTVDPFQMTNVFNDPAYTSEIPTLQSLLAALKGS